MKRLLRSIAISLAFLVSVDCSQAAADGYLFVTFKGESPNGEQIYFALSHDGRHWSALNNSKPVLTSQIGEQGVRDPYLLRMHDGGKFVLLATDLSIYRRRTQAANGAQAWREAVQQGSRSLAIWEFSDLVQWDGPRLIAVASPNAGCAWAPEAVYNPDSGDYIVFWASKTADDQFKKHRIWASHTRDFKTFGLPSVFIERSSSVIDTTIVEDAGSWYRFTKDESRKAITMEFSPSVKGPWMEIPAFTLGTTFGVEGPECYRLNAADGRKKWCLIVDYYAKSLGYRPFVTQELGKGNFIAGEDFSFPFKFRHGSVLPITGEEFARLERGALQQQTATSATPKHPVFPTDFRTGRTSSTCSRNEMRGRTCIFHSLPLRQQNCRRSSGFTAAAG